MQTKSFNITSYMCQLVGKEAERIRLIPNGAATSVVAPNETEAKIALKIFNDIMDYLEDEGLGPEDAALWCRPLAWAFYAGMGCAHAWANHIIALESYDNAIEYLTRTNGIGGMDDFVRGELALNKEEIDDLRVQVSTVTARSVIKNISDIMSETGFREPKYFGSILCVGAKAMFSLGVTSYAQRTKKEHLAAEEWHRILTEK